MEDCARRFVLLKLANDRHETSRDLFATAELLVNIETSQLIFNPTFQWQLNMTILLIQGLHNHRSLHSAYVLFTSPVLKKKLNGLNSCDLTVLVTNLYRVWIYTRTYPDMTKMQFLITNISMIICNICIH